MERTTQILVEALHRALAAGDEQRLVKSGKLEGLFPGRTGAAGEAAAQALRDGLLEVAHTETKGKTTIDWVRLTPRGVHFLHDHQSPAAALHELRKSLRLNQQAVPVWLAEMRAGLHALEERLAADAQKWQQRLEALTRRAEDTLRRLEEAAPLLPPDLAEAYPWAIDALNYIDRRRNGGAPDDCPLPELFAALRRAACRTCPSWNFTTDCGGCTTGGRCGCDRRRGLRTCRSRNMHYSTRGKCYTSRRDDVQ